MARFASNPFQVVYLFSNKKLQFTHTVSMYPWIIYRNCSTQLLLYVFQYVAVRFAYAMDWLS